MVGYAREMIGSSIGGYVGAANEITFRFDFNDESYQDRFKTDYGSSKAYNRKMERQGARQAKKMQKELEAPKKKFKLRKNSPDT